MTDTVLLSIQEILVVLALLSLMAWEVRQAYRSRLWVNVYRPTLFVAVILGFYALFAPLQALLSTGAVFSRLVDHRKFLLTGWLGALVFYGFLLVGFYAGKKFSLPRRMIQDFTPERMYRFGRRLCVVGLFLFVLVRGISILDLLNPLAAGAGLVKGGGARGIEVGGIVNYFNYSLNIMIPGICLMFAAWLRDRRRSLELAFWGFSALAIFTSLGFRYRLVLLVIPALLLFYFVRSRRPPVTLVSIFLVLFVLVNSIIGLTRNYGSGLDLSRLQGHSSEELIGDSGLGEQGVFLASAAVMYESPERIPYVGPAPVISTVLFPIPRAFFPAKPEGEYVMEAIKSIYGAAAPGAAFLNYTEYYLMAGWPSLIAMSLLFGWLLRRLWNWFLWRQEEPFAQVTYLVTASYLYMVISRGYMPQVVMLFIFTVAPLYWLYGRLAKPVSSLDGSAPLPRG